MSRPHDRAHSRSRPYHAPQHTSPFLLASPSPSHSTTTSHQSAMDDDDVAPYSPPHPPPRLTPTAASHRTVPVREDCWSEEATSTLVEAWGDRYVELNRGNLRQKDWQDVADAVNAVHGHVAKARRTDVQCKNRIDTLKKYKVEKSKLLASKGGRYSSPWKFFSPMDSLLGPSFQRSPAPAPTPLLPWETSPALPPPPSSVPVGPRSKRPAPAGNPNYRRNFSAEVSDVLRLGWRARNDHRQGRELDVDGAEVYRELAEAITRLGKIYERVEEEKQRQIIELEKQKMQFAKDLEIQRIKLFMESQVQFQKLKMSSKQTSRQSDYSGQ